LCVSVINQVRVRFRVKFRVSDRVRVRFRIRVRLWIVGYMEARRAVTSEGESGSNGKGTEPLCTQPLP